MAGSSFGTLFRFTSWGESHGPAIGCVVDGAPPITAPARVRIGPAEMALTRTPCGPRSAAR